MNVLETKLRLSLIQIELRAIASVLGPRSAKVVRFSASVLNVLRNPGIRDEVPALAAPAEKERRSK